MRLQQWIMDLCAVSVSVWGLVMGGCLTQPKKPNWAVLLPELNQTLRHSKAAGRLCEAHFSHVHQLPRSFYPELLTRGDSWCQSPHIFAGTTLSTRPAFLTFRLTFDCYFHRSRRPPQGVDAVDAPPDESPAGLVSPPTILLAPDITGMFVI